MANITPNITAMTAYICFKYLQILCGLFTVCYFSIQAHVQKCLAGLNLTIKTQSLVLHAKTNQCAFCVTVRIVGQWSSPGQPLHNQTETVPLRRSEHPLQIQSKYTHTHTHQQIFKSTSSGTIVGEMLPPAGRSNRTVVLLTLHESLMIPPGRQHSANKNRAEC